ncbi:MAG: CAP domain-containing protein [Nitrospirota bacterium]
MKKSSLIFLVSLFFVSGCGDVPPDMAGMTDSELPPAPAKKIPLLQPDQQTLLDTHNNERALLAKDYNVKPLAWSPQLVAFAQAWADQLLITNTFVHNSVAVRSDKNQTGHDGIVGENLWSGWSTDPNKTFLPADMVMAWINEKSDYNYFGNFCAAEVGKTCGHYTQVVWKNSTVIGCGRAKKSDATGVKEVLVCNYSPAGNVQGHFPY